MYGPINPSKLQFHANLKSSHIAIDGWRVPLMVAIPSTPSSGTPQMERIYVYGEIMGELHRVWTVEHRPGLLLELLEPPSEDTELEDEPDEPDEDLDEDSDEDWCEESDDE
jgi:hypothetical protein